MRIRLFFFRPSCQLLLGTIVAAIISAGLTTTAWSIGFQPVSPDELKMTSDPNAPGAPAIILYRQVDRDDRPKNTHEDVYFRIKIFTEEGRKYADIEIPYSKETEKVINIRARTIKPDGSIVDFDSKIFDKLIVKARGVKYMAKTFTLPDVQAGGIIEYYYTINLSDLYVGYNSHWVVSSELFTKSAKFSLKPYDGQYPPLYMQWTWHSLPPGTPEPKEGGNHVIALEVSNVPPFPTEDYMPPADELKAHVDFIYSEDQFEQDADKYWKKVGKKRNDRLESFIGKRKAMEEAAATIVAPGDSPQVKLEKIYARVQQLRNTSYEAEKTQQEQKREKEKSPGNVEELWKKQYGEGWQLTWLFLGLARAAGFEASGMWVSDRQHYFFHQQTMEGRRLNSNVVVVKLDGKDVFLDPGSAFVPFGMLPWMETGVPGLKLDKDGGSWLQTTLPRAKESQVQHKAELHLTDTGDLEGKLTVTFTGLEAVERRVEERLADDTARKKYLEDEVKASIPAASEVDLTNSPDWRSSTPLVAEFTLKVPGWISGAGRRALLPVGLFSNPEKHVFAHSDRVHPIYVEHSFERVDDISIDLPLGWQIGTLPAPKKENGSIVVYTMQAENNKGTLHLTRILDVDFPLMIGKEYYPALRQFFQVVRTDDEQQVVLQPAGASASK